jgi:hypothetical protein
MFLQNFKIIGTLICKRKILSFYQKRTKNLGLLTRRRFYEEKSGSCPFFVETTRNIFFFHFEIQFF